MSSSTNNSRLGVCMDFIDRLPICPSTSIWLILTLPGVLFLYRQDGVEVDDEKTVRYQ